jgi:manganese oxidase
MKQLFTLKQTASLLCGTLLAGTVGAAVVPVTVEERVDLSRRDIVLKNTVTGADQTIRMWTFSPGGTFSFGGGGGGFNDPNAPFPGPLLVFRESDTVNYTFRDTCPCEFRSSSHPYAGHTIHLHGLDVNTFDDGVHDTSFSILPGQSYTYKMKTREAGTFIYHCHIHTVLHQQMGMYGGIVVTPADSEHQNMPFSPKPGDTVPTFARQYMWVLAEVDKAWHDKASNGDFGDSAQFAYFTQYNPQHFFIANYHIDVATLKTTIGGHVGRGIVKTPNHNVAGKVGDTILIRTGNLGYWNKKISMGGLKFDVVATDGKPIRNVSHALDPIKDQTSIEAGAGERYELMVKLPTTPGTYTAKVDFLEPHKKTVVGSVTQTINVCAGMPASAHAC